MFMLARPGVLQVGEKGNFWIVEGIACYFESLKLEDDCATLGDPANPRIVAARYRRVVDDFYVPLAELTRMTRAQLQQDPRIAKLYSQASGLTWFLEHADEGRYREPLVEYLQAIYAGRDAPQTLTDRTGRSYVELDAAYFEYVKSLPAK
jgi:hypothetical protein